MCLFLMSFTKCFLKKKKNKFNVFIEKENHILLYKLYFFWEAFTRMNLNINQIQKLETEHRNRQTQEQFFPPGRIPPEQHITPPGTVHL